MTKNRIRKINRAARNRHNYHREDREMFIGLIR
jgi:hypothetical protein